MQTVRWQLFQTAGKIVRHGRQLFLKIRGAMLDAFAAIRERCARVMREGGVIPETRDPGYGIFALLGGRAHRAAELRRSKTPTPAVEIDIGRARKASAAAVSRKTG